MELEKLKIFQDRTFTILILISSIFIPIIGPFLALIIAFIGIKKYLINSKDHTAALLIIFGFMFVFISVYFHAILIGLLISKN